MKFDVCLQLIALIVSFLCATGSNGAAMFHHLNHHRHPDSNPIASVKLRSPQAETTLTSNSEILKPCGKYEDVVGKWVNVSDRAKYSDWSKHFHDHVVGQATAFDMLWLPNNCSYRRFDNTTLLKAVDSLIAQTQLDELHTVFFGDSALRGIFCALYRIYAGSETEGPCTNDICGFDDKRREISIPRIHRPRSVMVGPRWKVTFYYVKSFHVKQLPKLVADVIVTDRPYAVVINTGAWDFYEYNKRHRNETLRFPLSPRCQNNETQAIADLRANTFVADSIRHLSNVAQSRSPVPLPSKNSSSQMVAKGQHVRLIYRNNHFNRRYGALCADEQFEVLLHSLGTCHPSSMAKSCNESAWELWNNRNLSEAVWEQQSYDGFHFDWPILTYSQEDHRRVNRQLKHLLGQQPGMLVIQLAQSFLNSLFFSVLSNL